MIIFLVLTDKMVMTGNGKGWSDTTASTKYLAFASVKDEMVKLIAINIYKIN